MKENASYVINWNQKESQKKKVILSEKNVTFYFT